MRLIFLIIINFSGILTVVDEEKSSKSADSVDLNCGKPLIEPYENGEKHRVRRVINGMNAKPHSWPWLASLKLYGNLHHFCIGFLISRNFVLTAAHCLSKLNVTNFEVVFGLHELNRYRNAQFIMPKRLILHEDFKRGSGKFNDIALIELSRPVKLSNRVSLLCLPDLDSVDINFYRSKFYVSGWGKTNSSSEKRENSNILKQTTLNIVINSLCTYNQSQFCTSNEQDESNICFGDSGTPLMLKDEKKDRWYAYGIASHTALQRKNINLCNNKSLSHFTSILFFRSWIESKIKQSYRNDLVDSENKI